MTICVNLDHRVCFDQCPLLKLLWLDAGLPPLAKDPTVGEEPESEDAVTIGYDDNTHTSH